MQFFWPADKSVLQIPLNAYCVGIYRKDEEL